MLLMSLIWTTLSMLVETLTTSTLLWTVVVCAVTSVVVFVRRRYTYWSRLGVPGPRACLPWGTPLGCSFVTADARLERWLYHEQGGRGGVCGFLDLLQPTLYVGDPRLIRDITVRHFEHFTDRRDLTLSRHFVEMVSQLSGEPWKRTRSVITPAFSTSKLRAMHPLCLHNTDRLVDYLARQLDKAASATTTSPLQSTSTVTVELDMKDTFGRFTMDNIALCAFGVRCNSFENPDTPFTRNAARLFRLPSGPLEMARILMMTFLPGRLVYALTPDPYTTTAKFFSQVVQDTIDQRTSTSSPTSPSNTSPHPSTSSGDKQKRHDFLSLLLETRDDQGRRMLSNSSVLCQAMLFFIAGYDTTANLLQYAAYCLADNDECQQRARQEVDRVLAQHDGQLSYEAVAAMTYVEHVLDETLRLYPPLAHLDRECTRSYTLTLPPSQQIISGARRTITVERGTLVRMPVLELHRDPRHYPDPMKFRPDRFESTDVGAGSVNGAKDTGTTIYMPFGSGPRQCLARRFAIYEAKAALAAVLRRFELRRAPNTPQEPIQFDAKNILLTPQGGKMPILISSRQ